MSGRFILAFLAITVTVDASPLWVYRHRRQAETVPAVCPVQCAWSFSQAWSKAISFEVPTANMIDEDMIVITNTTFGVMCSLYSAFKGCLRACAAGNSEFANVLNGTPTYHEICSSRQAEYDSYLPCLSNNTRTYQRVCQSANEQLLAASIRLTTGSKFSSSVARHFCSAANEQAYCIFPVIQQTCGDAPSEALRSLVNASFIGIRSIVGPALIDKFYPECGVYFETIAHGISTPTNVDASANANASTTATTAMESVTAAVEPSIETTTASMIVLRDDGNSSVYNDRPLQQTATTTETSGGQRSVIFSNSNLLAFFFIWILFHFS